VNAMSLADWVVIGGFLGGFIFCVLWLTWARRQPPASSPRGEEAKAKERNDEMAVARAAGVEPQPSVAPRWDLWEEQCYSLEPVVERVARIKEGRR
jgi:hypothetical protein